jgi:deoxyribonuclease-1
MRAVVIALGFIATAPTLPALANGQDKIADLQTSEQLLWSTVYRADGSSLYCAKPFSEKGGLFSASQIYNGKQLKRSLRCITDRQCSIMNPRYPYIAADLHNLYPALTRVEEARGNAQFKELGAEVPSAFEDIGCDLKTAFKAIEPRDQAKGNIARAMFYMHIEYDLPLVGPAAMYKKWHQLDPPDAEEQARNDSIEKLQGTRNRFIDDPGLADRLIAD